MHINTFWIVMVAFVITFVQIICRITATPLFEQKWHKIYSVSWFITIIAYIITAIAIAGMLGIH